MKKVTLINLTSAPVRFGNLHIAPGRPGLTLKGHEIVAAAVSPALKRLIKKKRVIVSDGERELAGDEALDYLKGDVAPLSVPGAPQDQPEQMVYTQTIGLPEAAPSANQRAWVAESSDGVILTGVSVHCENLPMSTLDVNLIIPGTPVGPGEGWPVSVNDDGLIYHDKDGDDTIIGDCSIIHHPEGFWMLDGEGELMPAPGNATSGRFHLSIEEQIAFSPVVNCSIFGTDGRYFDFGEYVVLHPGHQLVVGIESQHVIRGCNVGVSITTALEVG